MTAYSVINPSNLIAGQPEDVSVVLANFNAIAAVVNNLDNSNISPSAAIVYSKLSLTGGIVNADISPTAAISASKISGIGGSIPATTLPASPTDGQQAVLVDNTSSPTYSWLFQWSATASKWFFIGGSDAYSQVLTDESSGNNGYTNLATVGPQVTVPRAGVYEISWSCNGTGAAGGNGWQAAVKLGAAATSINEGVQITAPSAGAWFQAARLNMQRTLAASDVVLWQANPTGATAHYANRNLAVKPVWVT
ncbi:MAG TPA: hypothetical protein VH593_24090 [Ktedonobacteraceae bacterium]|jgi:hypothetical protein